MSRREERGLLDTARWICAAAVAITHITGVVLRPPGGYLGHVYTNLGHCGVVIFFVLSGYLVGGGLLARRNDLKLSSYAVARFSRIYIVLIPALLLTMCLDGLAYLIDRDNPVYATVWPSAIFGETAAFDRYGPIEVISAIFSLEAFTQTMGTAVPLWSLGFEWLFYFLFPGAVLAANFIARRSGSRALLCTTICVITVANVFIGFGQPYAALLWLIWTAGAAASVVAERGAAPGWLRYAGLAVCIVGVLLPILGRRGADPLIGIGFAVFLSSFPRDERGLNARFDRWMAGRSYSLYVTHLPVVAFIAFLANRAGWLPVERLSPGPASLGLIAMMLAAIALVAMAFHHLYESRTDDLRAWLTRSLRLQPRPNPVSGSVS